MSERPSNAVVRGRWKFAAVVALFAGPVLLAVAWYSLVPQTAPAAAAHGTLIDPARPLEPFELATSDPARGYSLEDLRGQWTLVHVIGEQCSAGCRERLYFTRQIHTALGKDQGRVQRLALASLGTDTAGLDAVLDEHPRLTVLAAGPGDPLRRQLPDDVDVRTVLLIDPLGNLMLRFDADVEPDGILEDLEKLLKLSRIG